MIIIKFDTDDLDSEDRRYFSGKEVRVEGCPEYIDEYVSLFRAFLTAMTFSPEVINEIIKDPVDRDCCGNKLDCPTEEDKLIIKGYKMNETAG